MTSSLTVGRYSPCPCGAPAIVIPADISDSSPILCGGCQGRIGNWLGYKAFVGRSIAAEQYRSDTSLPICVDPLLIPSRQVLPTESKERSPLVV